MNKKTIGIVLTLLGLFMLSYGVIVSGAFTANNSDKDNTKDNTKEQKKKETLETIAKDIVIYDENNIKITLNKIIKFKSDDVYYFDMDCDLENNTKNNYSITIRLKANNISNSIISGYKEVRANTEQNMKEHAYDSYLEKFDIDDFYNANLEIIIVDYNSGESYEKIYKLENTYLKEDKDIGTLLFSNDKVEVRALRMIDDYSPTAPNIKVVPIIIKNKLEDRYDVSIPNNTIKVDGEEVFRKIDDTIDGNTSYLGTLLFKSEKNMDSINKIEFQVLLEKSDNTNEKILTDVITFNNK